MDFIVKLPQSGGNTHLHCDGPFLKTGPFHPLPEDSPQQKLWPKCFSIMYTAYMVPPKE